MAIFYFTTNAATGDGSLADAVANASSGDTIAPSPNVWNVGDVIQITPAATIAPTVTCTIAGSGRRIKIYAATLTVFNANTSGTTLTLEDVDFVECVASSGAYTARASGGALVLNRCRVVGCAPTTSGTTGGTVGASAGSLVIQNCAIYGNIGRNGAVFGSSSATVEIDDSTIIGNDPRDLYCGSSTTRVARRAIFQNVQNFPTSDRFDCVVGAPSTIGFIAAPPDSFTYSTQSWQNYDLHLEPSSIAATGRNATGGVDLDGIDRIDDGAVGAFEYVAADCFVRGSTVATTRGGTYAAITGDNVAGRVLFETGGVVDLLDAEISSVQTTGWQPLTLENVTITGADDSAGIIAPALYAAVTLSTGADFVTLAANLTDATVSSGATIEILDAFAGALAVPTGVSIVLRVAPESTATATVDGALECRAASTFATLAVASSGTVTGSDFISVTTTATISGEIDAPIFATPPGTDLSGATVMGTACDYGAGLSSFNASPDGSQILFQWTKTETTPAVLLQTFDGSDWTTVVARASGTSYTGGTYSGATQCRAFDGVRYFTARASNLLDDVQFCVISSAYGTNQRAESDWQILTEVVGVTNVINIDQAVTILAQVADAFDPTDYLLNTGANISAVSYTAYFIRNGAFSQGTPVAVTGHTNVNVSTDCVLSSLQTSEKWTLDSNGFSFALTPDVTTSPLFATVGDYQIKVTITPTVGNPIVFYVPITVKPLEN